MMNEKEAERRAKQLVEELMRIDRDILECKEEVND